MSSVLVVILRHVICVAIIICFTTVVIYKVLSKAVIDDKLPVLKDQLMSTNLSQKMRAFFDIGSLAEINLKLVKCPCGVT